MLKAPAYLFLALWALAPEVSGASCASFFLEGLEVRHAQDANGPFWYQHLPLTLIPSYGTGHILSIERRPLENGFDLLRMKVQKAGFVIAADQALVERVRQKWEQNTGLVLNPSFEAYESRRDDFDPNLTPLLRGLWPGFLNDATTLAMISEETLVGTLRLVRVPLDETASGYLGYPSHRYRPPVISWKSGAPSVTPQTAGLYSFLPHAALPGEQVLNRRVNRRGLSVLWEFTNLFLHPGWLRQRHALRSWLWREANDEIFFAGEGFSYSRQGLFTYGTPRSLGLYRDFGFQITDTAGVQIGQKKLYPFEARPRDFARFNYEGGGGRKKRFASQIMDQVRNPMMVAYPSAVFDFLNSEQPMNTPDGQVVFRNFQIAQSTGGLEGPMLEAKDQLFRGLSHSLPARRVLSAKLLGERKKWAPSLCKSDGSEVLDGLLDLLSDPHSEVRITVLKALEPYLEELRAHLEKMRPSLASADPEEVLRAIYLITLVLDREKPFAPGELLPALAKHVPHPDPRISASALWAVGLYSDRAKALAAEIERLFLTLPAQSRGYYDAGPFHHPVDYQRYCAAQAYFQIGEGPDRAKLMERIEAEGSMKFSTWARSFLATGE